ncbi:MAG: hypothetical protein GPJ54_11390 [Candidatus Heimdallarchaeota archaeon]|nr:hypothetical protein [Candidatus Heimdallarchaeota archaeon]
MGISRKTIEIITENNSKFSDDLRGSIHDLIGLATEYSPLSDVTYLANRSNTELRGIKIEIDDNSWVPIRNVIRIIGKIADEVSNESSQVTEIQINSMYAGCDYFEGHLSYTVESKGMNSGNYKWQWTAFPGYDRNYNKFKLFPNDWAKIQTESNKIPA